MTDHTRIIRAFAPATVGNVACGFDVLGLALDQPGDEVRARFREAPGVEILRIVGDGGRLPLDAERNSAGIAARAVLRAAGLEGEVGVSLELHKGLPLSSGLGGSAASSVAGALAVNTLLGNPLPKGALLSAAEEGETLGAGASHLDNAAPCLLGGICLVLPGAGNQATQVVELPVPEGLSVAVVHPHMEIRTEEARALLGDTVELATAIRQWGNTAGFVAALHRGDMELLARTVVDLVAEPKRRGLIPGFERVMAAARGAGALGGSLSGSGPSLFALAPSPEVALRAGAAMAEAFAAEGLDSDVHAGPVSERGARILPDLGA
jgi:homoserine kinase